MFARFFQAKAEKKNAFLIYRALVTQARSETFYTKLGVKDDIKGRFDMILLHLFLVDHRLEQEGQDYVRLRRYIQETMVTDMDRSFRELGVGDMSVGKEMKKVGAAWLGRRAAYAQACEEGESFLKAIKTNIYQNEDHDGISGLNDYVERAQSLLQASTLTAPNTVALSFPAV